MGVMPRPPLFSSSIILSAQPELPHDPLAAQGKLTGFPSASAKAVTAARRWRGLCVSLLFELKRDACDAMAILPVLFCSRSHNLGTGDDEDGRSLNRFNLVCK